MKYVGRLVKMLLLAAAVSVVTTPASAQLVGFLGYFKLKTESDVTVGLDEPTRRLINGLPAEVKVQVLDALRQAMPMVDKSVNAYLDKANEIVNSQINHLVCAGQAFAKGTVEEIGAAVRGKSPTPLLDLQRQFEEREQKFESRPQIHLVIEYEDFLGRASVTACQSSDPTNIGRVDALRAAARARWHVWYDVQDRCDSPSACYQTRIADVRALISKSEQRDLSSVGAVQAFESVNQRYKPDDGFIARMGRSTKDAGPWLKFEVELLKLRAIETSLNSTRNLRLMLAGNAYTDAMALLQNGEDSQKSGRLSLHASDVASNNRAIALAAAGTKDKTEIDRLLKIADANDVSMHGPVTEATKRIPALDTEAAAISSAALYNIGQIKAGEQAAADEAARKQAERFQRILDKSKASR